jgi:hypothetical protein
LAEPVSDHRAIGELQRRGGVLLDDDGGDGERLRWDPIGWSEFDVLVHGRGAKVGVAGEADRG